jgi:integrase
MPLLRLTKRTLDGITPSDRSRIYYDTDLKGFGLRVQPSGAKSWIVEYRPGEGGRGVATRRVTLGSSSTLAPDEARRAARDILAKVRFGQDPAAERSRLRQVPDFREFAEKYLSEEAAAKLKRRTLANYRIYLLKHAAAELGSSKLSNISTAQVAKLHRLLGRSKPVTANRTIRAISSVFRYAAECGFVEKGFNPAAGIEHFRESSRERYLTTSELESLGKALYEAEAIGFPRRFDRSKATRKHIPKKEQRTLFSPHAVAAIRLLLLTGARLREILHARWTDVDSERGLLLLPDSKTGRRYIILNGAALAVINRLPPDGEFIIAGDQPNRPRSDLNRPWQAVAERAGLLGVRLHDLRHTHASIGASGGFGLPVLGKLLGHSQAATTARYAHLDADPLRRASNAIGDAIERALAQGHCTTNTTGP